MAAPQPGDYDPSTGKGPEWGKAAPIGLLVILLLCVALVFLLRSFTRQLKKVPASFDVEPIGAGPSDPADSVTPVPATTDRRGRAPSAPATERGPTTTGEGSG
jgi:hypothetical protein